jgi:zinc transport system ATP-binding protein
MSEIISCKDAAFGYDGRIVLRDLNWSAGRGDYICIAGENGTGKSTLVKGILRLLPPMRGSISFFDIKKNEIGYLAQQTASQKDFPAGAYEIVLQGNLGGMGLRPFYSRLEKKIALENMERLGISNLRDACFRELSGGQQRRVLLARALCASKKLLVMDEPMAGLDPLVSVELYALLSKINKELPMTIIMVTHDIPPVLNSATKILHLRDKQNFFGTAVEYAASEAGRCFLNKT